MVKTRGALSFYEVLDVPVDAKPDDIRRGFRQLAHKYHPDKDPSNEAKQAFATALRAYKVLSDDARKQRYDGMLKKKLDLREADERMRTSREGYSTPRNPAFGALRPDGPISWSRNGVVKPGARPAFDDTHRHLGQILRAAAIMLLSFLMGLAFIQFAFG